MIHDDVLPQLQALRLDPVRPLFVVDVDEVLVGLAGHLGEFAAEHGFTLKLTGYKLDGALKRADGSTASPDEFRTLFTTFFETQTRHQRVYPHAARVLDSLSATTQVLILTNVPTYAHAARIDNLRGHGIDYPLVVNQGGKGGPLAWLAERTDGPMAFIDDSPTQIASAAQHAPHVTRLHFVGDDHLRSLLDPLDDAHFAPETWLDVEAIVSDVLVSRP